MNGIRITSRMRTWLSALLCLCCVGLASAQEPARLSDDEMKKLLESINDRTGKFRDAVERGTRKGKLDTRLPDQDINRFVKDFEDSTGRLKDRFNSKRSASADVEEVLRRAATIDGFMKRHPVVTGADAEWLALRGDLDQLVRAYNVSWRWDDSSAAPERLSDSQVKVVLEELSSNTGEFRSNLEKSLKQDPSVERQVRDNVNQTVKTFKGDADRLKGRMKEKDFPTQLEQVLRLAASVDRFMKGRPESDRAQGDWRRVRRNLEQLAQSYKLPWGAT